MTAPPSVTLVTVTCRRDLDRLALQRASIERLGIALPHLVIVDDDCAVAPAPGLTVVRKRALLARPVRARAGGGWREQQLVKLAAAQLVDTDGVVLLDSDVFFVRPVSGADFASHDGRLHLYESPVGLDAEMAAWPAAAMRFLGIEPQRQPVRRYTFAPMVMARRLVGDLCAAVEARHRRPWCDALVRAPDVMEYTLYGVFVRGCGHADAVAPVEPTLARACWWFDDVDRLAATILDPDPAVRAVLVQSNLGVEPAHYRGWAEAAWARRDPA